MSSDRHLSIGLQTMQSVPWAELRDDWSRYEAQGWDSLWLPDHLIPPSGGPGPFHEAWTLLSALAITTQRARIGVLVSSNTFRHPALLAKQAVTVDHLCGGRLELGIGAGWFQEEHDQFGLTLPPIGERVSRYAEALALIDTYLSNPTATYTGSFYEIHDAANDPPPVQQPRIPITVGAHGPRTIRIAARHADIWNSRGTVDEMRERNALMDEACVAAGRAPSVVTRSLMWNPARYSERPWDSPDAFAAFVGPYAEIGISHFIFETPAREDRASVERIAHDALDGLRRRS